MANNALEASLSPPSVASEWQEAAPDTLGPSHFDLRPALSSRAPRMPPRKTLLAAAAVIVALLGVIVIVTSSTKSEPVALAAPPSPAPTVKTTPAPAEPPTAVRPPATAKATAAPVTNGDPLGLVESAKLALFGTENTENAVLVTIRVSPPNAVVLKRGLRLGTGTVTIKVARGSKMTLSAQLYGYVPHSFVVDGENNSISIDLRRPPRAR